MLARHQKHISVSSWRSLVDDKACLQACVRPPRTFCQSHLLNQGTVHRPALGNCHYGRVSLQTHEWFHSHFQEQMTLQQTEVRSPWVQNYRKSGSIQPGVASHPADMHDLIECKSKCIQFKIHRQSLLTRSNEYMPHYLVVVSFVV